MILDAANQKQAINEYAKMESNGFWGGKILVEICFFLCLFLPKKKCNLAVVGVFTAAGRKKKFYIWLSRGTKLPKR